MRPISALFTGVRPFTVSAQTTVYEAALSMQQRNVGAALVVDASGAPLGIFTERDLMTRVVVPRKNPDTVRVGEVMTRDLFIATPTQTIREVRSEMQRRHIRHLPVIENGRVFELLSLRDLLRADLDEQSGALQDLTQYIQGPEHLA